jgi:lipoate-protein ligase B
MKPLLVVDAGVVPYELAYEWQRELHGRKVERGISDVLLLLEHPHVYTLGRKFSREHLLLSDEALADRGIAVHEADRGGSITYHGPGQLVGYPIVDLRRPGSSQDSGTEPDAILYLRRLEQAIIRTVRHLGVAAGRREGLTGVWVGDGKLAAIGVNVTRGVSKHGFALNVSTDLSYFEGMVPCGIPEARPTSLLEILREAPPMKEVASLVASNLGRVLHSLPVPATLKELGIFAPEEVAQAREDAEVIPLRRSRTERGIQAAGR